MTPEQITLAQSPSQRLSSQRPAETTGVQQELFLPNPGTPRPATTGPAQHEVKFGHELTEIAHAGPQRSARPFAILRLALRSHQSHRVHRCSPQSRTNTGSCSADRAV